MSKRKFTATVLAFLMILSCTQIVNKELVNAEEISGQTKYLLADENLSSGVHYEEEDIVNYLGKDGYRLRINHLTVDPNDQNTQIISKKAKDTVNTRATVLAQAQEEADKGKNVIGGINADSFDIDSLSGISRSINVYDGYVLQSQPYDNYNKCDPADSIRYRYQSVLYVDTNRKVHVGPLNSNANAEAGNFKADVTPLNRNDFTYTAQNEGYRAFTSIVTEDHILRYINSRNASSGFTIPRTIRYAIVEIDPVNNVPFDGFVKAGQQYTGKVIEKKETNNFKISDNLGNTGTSTNEFIIPENCIVIAGYTTKLPEDELYSETKAAQIEKLTVGQSITYTCNLYTGYGFDTGNNSKDLTGTNAEDLLVNVISALGDFNTLALNGVANTLNNKEVFMRSAANTARTMVGISEDGKVHLLTVASPSASMPVQDSRGTNYEDITYYMMNYLNCKDVLSMDGGGSTTMVARRAGESSLSVVNYPSDGSPRIVGNSLLVVNTDSTAPSDTVAQVILGSDINVYLNTSYQFNVKLTDASGNLISAKSKNISYTAVSGVIDKNGFYKAPDTACTDTVTVTVDSVSASIKVKVVDTFVEAVISPKQIPLKKGDVQQFTLTAYDAARQRIFIDPSLITWSLSNPAIGTLENGLLTVTAETGKTDVSAVFANTTYTTCVYVGLKEQIIEDFETTSASAYHLSGYMYGTCGEQRGGQNNKGDENKYIGFETKDASSSLVKNGTKSLRITGLTENWTNRSKNGTMNLYPDWDAAHPDFAWTEEQRAVLEESFTAKALPKKFGLWVYSPDNDNNGVSDNASCQLTANFLQNCPGSKVSGYDSQRSALTLASKVDWIGWKWVEVDIPQTWDMPVVFNWMYLVNTDKAVGTDKKNEIIIDDLKFVYTKEEPSVEAPIASPTGDTYAWTPSVTLSCPTEGATIRYTIDGSEPNESTSTVYTTPIIVTDHMTIKAKAFKSGMKASVTMTETYTIRYDIPAVPDVSADEETIQVGTLARSITYFEGDIGIDISANTFVTNTRLTVRKLGEIPGNTAEKLVPLSQSYELDAGGSSIDEPIQLSIRYNKVNAKDIDKRKLGIFRQDDNNTKNWIYVGGVIDADNSMITAKINKTGKYAVMFYQKLFTDLHGHWSNSDVEVLASRFIIDGMSEDKFEPENLITRAELLKLMVGILTADARQKIDIKDFEKPAFTDVADKSAWYYKYVEAGLQLGIINGGNGLFRPDETVTREEMVVMIIKVLDLKNPLLADTVMQLEFKDNSDISDWAQESISKAQKYGLIQGFGDGMFMPDRYATRAQAAVITMRAMDSLGLINTKALTH